MWHCLLFPQQGYPSHSHFWKTKSTKQKFRNFVITKSKQVAFQSLPLFIIAGECYETSKCHRKREEYLSCSVQPHLRILQDLPLEQSGEENRKSVRCVWDSSYNHMLHENKCWLHKLTLGVKRYTRPSVAPGRVRARTRKIVRTK